MKLRIVALALTSLLVAASLRGAVITWDGSTNGDFSDNTNWVGDVAPVPGDSLLFPNTPIPPNLTITLSAGFSATNLTFDDNDYTLAGSGLPTLTLTGNIALADSHTTFDNSLGLQLSGGSNFINTDATSSLILNSSIVGTGALVKSGDGGLTLGASNLYSGGTIVNGGILSVINGDVSHAAVDLQVGGTGLGASLNLYDGSVSDLRGRIGIASGDIGSASVRNNSTWTNAGYLYVGEAGSGSLNIETTSAVSAANISIGNNTGGTGAVTVDGIGTTLSQTDTGVGNGLYIGSQGYGTLALTNGGVVNSVTGSIGNNAGGAGGLVTINGSGSAWHNSGTLYVGASVAGSLTVSNQGALTTQTAKLGNSSGSTGSVTITGSGSSWSNSGTLTVGYAGTGTLQISSGATVTTAQALLGEQSGSSGTARIFGAGSTLNVTGTDFYVGNGGTGIAYVYNGGKITVGGGSGVLHLGHSAPNGVGILNLGTDGTSYFSGGVINAAEIRTGAGLSGELKFATTGTAVSPYYLTKDGTSTGAPVLISGATQVHQLNGLTVLKSSNNYTGATHVSGGTLIVSDANALGLGNSPVTIDGGTLVVNSVNLYNPLSISSGTLAGNGFVAANTTIATNAILSPGLPADGGRIGSLDFAHLELASGGVMEWNLQNPNSTAGVGWDKVIISTPTTLDITATTGSRFTLKLISLALSGAPGTATGFVPGQAYSWLVFDSDSTASFNAAKFNLDVSQFVTDSALIANLSLTQTGQKLYLNFTPVPEPSTYALLALGLAGSGFAAWRRRRKF